MMRLQQQFLIFLTLASVGSSNVAAFVPPNKLRASLKALRSTSPTTSTTSDTTAAADDLLNQDKFLADMNRELPSSKAQSSSPKSPDMIPADPTYVTEARLRFAALADEAEELKQQYELEIQDLRAKSVWESFKTRKQIREEERKAKKAQVAPTQEVETAEATSSSSSDSSNSVAAVWIGVALVVAVASFVAVEPVSVANLDLNNLNTPNMDLDLTSIQEQAQANVAMMLVWFKEMQTMFQTQITETQLASTAKFQVLQSDMFAGASNWKDAAMTMTNNVQDTLAKAGADWEATVPSMLTSAGEDLKRALLRQ